MPGYDYCQSAGMKDTRVKSEQYYRTYLVCILGYTVNHDNVPLCFRLQLSHFFIDFCDDFDVQRRATQSLQGIANLKYYKLLKKLGLTRLEKKYSKK